jgi:hypothetical protein
MIEVKVNPGICGLKSTIKAESADMMTAKVEIESECPAVMELADKIKTVDAMKEVFAPFGTSSIFTGSVGTLTHATCPVPTAILKAVEASCSLALPADVVIEIRKMG